MADPITVIGVIANVIQIGSLIINFIKTAKESTADRQKLLCEIRSTVAVCQSLQDSVEMGDEVEWKATLNLLHGPDRPLEQLQICFADLKTKLAPSSSASKTVVRALKWPFDKGEILDIYATIERQKALLNLALTNNNLKLSCEIRQELQGVARDVGSISAHQSDERRAVVLAKISSTNYEDYHASIADSRADGTGGWLLESTEFLTWQKTPGILLCKGIPGSGKTVLSSLVIDHLRQHRPEESAIVKIYCNYNDPQTAENLLRSALRQLVESLQVLPSFINEQFRPDAANISSVFSKVLGCFRSVKIIVDALNECQERYVHFRPDCKELYLIALVNLANHAFFYSTKPLKCPVTAYQPRGSV